MDLYLFDSRPFIGIKRHRLLTDGHGVTTLVAFHGCPLSCKYCLNPQCKTSDGIWQYLTPLQLYNRVKIDDIYFQATGGGVVFGGGEPLMESEFILSFSDLCKDDRWTISVETSLNVDPSVLCDMSPIIDEFIVDIKDMNPKTYISYTGKSNDNVIANLRWLVCHGLENKVLIRVPFIEKYNTMEDIENSIDSLHNMGFKRFDRIRYWKDVKEKRSEYTEGDAGKAVCDVLKSIRMLVAVSNDINYTPAICSHVGNCLGACPKCEEELCYISKELHKLKLHRMLIKI